MNVLSLLCRYHGRGPMNAFPDDPAVDGDPDAPDPNGAYEPILEDDPHPSLTMNPDAGDPLDDLDEGEDSDEPLDDDDDEPGEDPPPADHVGIM